MMTNLLSSAVMAKTRQLLSTLASPRLLLVMFVALTVSANAWGADVTFDTSAYSGKGGVSGTGGNATATIDGVTITSTKAYYTSAHIREYSGGTITVSSSSNITKIVFTSTASGTSSNGPGKISLNSGGGSYSYSGTAGTWTGSSTSIKFDCDAQFRWTKIVVTIADAHTVTWTINPAAGGTLSEPSGNSTTVSPNAAYTYGAPAYTVTPAGKANVSQDGDNFTAIPSANCTIQINMVEKTPATISFENMGNPIPTTTGYYVGDTYTLPATNDYTCGDKTFVGWSTEIIENSPTKPTAATYFEPGASVTLAADQTFYAVFAEGGGASTISWPKTEIADINDGDEVVVVMTKTDNYALFDNNGTSSAPTATPINIENDHISDLPVGDELIWVIGKSNSELTFYQNKTKEAWLYCTSTNDGVRVGTNANKVFTISGNYLNNTATSRYVGVYITKPDWRCYTSCTGNSNIAGQTLAFYKKTEKSSAQNYTTQCSNKPSLCLIQKEVAY